jgi:SAM-dependent methyltransferase
MRTGKRSTHYSSAYFDTFRKHGLVKQRILWAIDRKEPAFSHLKKCFPSQATLLDYGCGAGWFLKHAEEYFTTMGIDFSKEAIEIARQNTKETQLILGEVPALKKRKRNSVDIVTVFDVFEHVPDPAPLLEQFYRIMVDDGIMLVSMPNADSVLRRLLGDHWWGYADLSHLWILSEMEWREIIEKFGFRFERRYPSGLINYPKPPFALSGKYLWWHYVTQVVALAGMPLPNILNDNVILAFSKKK